MKILIISHKRWGKDSLAEIWERYFGLTYNSSSQAASNIFIYEALKEKYNYSSPEECFEDRMNRRKEWYDLITEYNKKDRTRLAREILKSSDCYVGMRDRNEIKACVKEKLFDLIVWVDASKRMPPEDLESFNIDESCAHIIIQNNGSLKEFTKKAINLGTILFN